MATKKTNVAAAETAETTETTEAENVSGTDTAEATEPAEPAEPEMVKVKLFKDSRRYKGDVFVSVNGRRYQIQRGVEVEVPAEVAEVLEHSRRQDELAAAKIEASEEK